MNKILLGDTESHPLLKNNSPVGLSCYIYIAFCVFFISGSNSLSHNYIQVGLFGLWCTIALLEDKLRFISAIANKTTVFLILFLLYYFLTSIFEADIPYVLTYEAVFFMLYSCYIPYLYYRGRGRRSEIIFIIFASLMAWAFFALSAIAFYQINPSAARTLAADFTAFDNLYIGGGYAIAFGSALLFVWIFSLLCKGYLNSNKLTKYFAFGFLILLFYLLIKTESTTTLLACIIGAVFSLIELLKNSKNIGSRILLVILCFFIVGFIISGGLSSFGTDLVAVTDDGANDNVLLRRFNRIGEKLMSAGSDSTTENYVDERWGLVVMSWNKFLEYPIFGMGYTVGNIFSRLEESGLGTHSEICDMLAQHGLVGFFFFFMYFKNALNCKGRKLANNGFIVTMLIMALFNPFRYYHAFYALLTLMPFIELLIKDNFRKMRNSRNG